uniref:periodic tryptophan protein 1 homolog n=1 Tax=Styela clava TaxID=7725 RepID=UPI001939A065|nr:periodic tryptophan protein 1 homolog [Styela clava]
MSYIEEDETDSEEDENDDRKDATKVGPEKSHSDEEDLQEYGLENYDDEKGDFTTGISGLVMFADNDADPYITKKSKSDSNINSDSEDESAEKSAVQLKPDDNLLVCARCGQHSSVLEVYVYNHKSGDFYVHHDIPLLETPLCMQWVGFDPGAENVNSGNLLAVGNFNGTIDIWDLDVLNSLEPVASIGKGKVSKQRRKIDFRHADAILDIAWTDVVHDQLASASADTAIALWDLELGKATRVFRDHKNKVQTLAWMPKSDKHLLSGAFDGNIIMTDTLEIRTVAQWTIDGEVERITWNNENSKYFVASCDSGFAFYCDVRKPTEFIHKWKAHEGAIPGLFLNQSDSKNNSCLLQTASSDGLVKLWDLNFDKPKLVHEKDMKMGMVHCCEGNPDENSVVAFGGQKGQVRLWDLAKISETAKYFDLPEQVNNINSDVTLISPISGDGEEDDEVLKYIQGEDYIKPNKINKFSKQNGNHPNGSGDSKKKKRKRKKKTSANQSIQNKKSLI